MTRGEFEADLIGEGYELREGTIEPNARRELHAHAYDARLLVLEGALTLVYEDRRITHRPGETCFVPAGTRHSEHTEADGVRFVAATRSPSPV